MNTKLHASCDSQGRPLSRFLIAGQVIDHIDASTHRRSWVTCPRLTGSSETVDIMPTGPLFLV
jgi:hypothetical protein